MNSPSGQPSIDVFGITVMEPMVTFTDLWITGVCIYAFIQLRKRNFPGQAHQYMRWYFLVMGIATFLGGILGHAFQYQIGIEWKLPGWLISMLSISALERATILYAQPVLNKKLGRFLEIANVIELLVFAIITFLSLNFFFIQIHSAYGLALIVFPIHFYVFWKTQNRGSKIIALSVIFSSLSAVFYISKVGLHAWFNHLDIAHTFMAVSLYFFYRGTLFLEPLTDQNQKKSNLSFSLAVRNLFKPANN